MALVSADPIIPSQPQTDPIEYDDEEKHVLASNDQSFHDEEEDSPEAVMFESNDVDTMNYDDEVYSCNINNNNKECIEDGCNSEEADSIMPISGLRIHEDAVCGISSSPHQALIASVGDDYRLVLYKINSEHRLQCIRRIKKRYLPVSISFDNTGDCLAISMIDGVIEIWDVATMKPIYTLKGHTGSVLKSVWSPSHRNTLASFSNDQTIRIWHPHSMPSTRCANIIQLTSNTLDIEWQKRSSPRAQAPQANGGSDAPLLSSVDSKNTLRLYDSTQHYKQIYVGRSMGDKIAFGEESLIAVNGYNLNLFDCQNLNRLNCIKTNQYHHGLINNVSIQHMGMGSSAQGGNQSQSDIYMSYSKGLFATSDESNDNILCVWQFNDDCTNAKCCGRIMDAHHKSDKKIYSLKVKRRSLAHEPKEPATTSAPACTQMSQRNTLPVPTAFDEEQSNNNNDEKINDIMMDAEEEEEEEEEEDDDDELDDDCSGFITNLEFCKHVPQYLLSSGKDGTIKLWDCNQFVQTSNT